ncbi:MAG: copper homeostasis protein CutC [Planctomycetaceae bacterium]|nr:copper homeostasis protein CutC [Planctomycetaceae bacterium]
MTTAITIELCAAGIGDCELAESRRLARLELNSAMPCGGLTPSLGVLKEARQTFSGRIIAMLRPREGGFCYSDAEFRVMLRDADLLLENGADGIAVGILTSEGLPDLERCEELRRLLPGSDIVFHRAFDVIPDPLLGMRQLQELGFTRILTSGGCQTALQGIPLLSQLQASAPDGFILPGGGIRANCIRQLIRQTGCRQFHTSCQGLITDSSTAHQPQLQFGTGTAEPAGNNGAYTSANADMLDELLNLTNC